MAQKETATAWPFLVPCQAARKGKKDQSEQKEVIEVTTLLAKVVFCFCSFGCLFWLIVLLFPVVDVVWESLRPPIRKQKRIKKGVLVCDHV